MASTSDFPDSFATKQALLDAKRLHQSGLLSEAQAAYERLLTKIPDDPDLLNLYGILQFQQGNLDVAEQRLRHLTKLHPSLGKAHVNLANVLMERGDLDQAASHFRMAIQIESENPMSYCNEPRRVCRRLQLPNRMELL